MQTESTRSQVRTICLMVIATAVATYLIYWLRPVLVPFVLALFVVTGIRPVLVHLQERLHVNQLIAAGITFVLGLMVLAALAAGLTASIYDLHDDIDAYEQRIDRMLRVVEQNLPPAIFENTPETATDSRWGGDRLAAGEPIAAEKVAAEKVATESGAPGEPAVQTEAVVPVPATRLEPRPSVQQMIQRTIGGGLTRISQVMFELASTSIVVLIYVFFMLLGSTDAPKLAVWNDIEQNIRSYIALKTAISLVTGVVFGISLYLFGVPMAITFGMLAFLLNFIPNVGPLIATVLPVPFILLDPAATVPWVVASITVISLIQTISGNVVEPKLMGNSSDLHPVVILLALMFWGMLWGITGMFLATPITAGIKIALERFEMTRPIAAVLAGRWDAPSLNSEDGPAGADPTAATAAANV